MSDVDSDKVTSIPAVAQGSTGRPQQESDPPHQVLDDSDSGLSTAEKWRKALTSVPALLAIVGLAFSGFTWAMAERSSGIEDRRTARTELSAILTEHQVLQAQGLLGSENGRPLAQAAHAILQREPSIRNPADGVALGRAFLLTNDWDLALQEFDESARRADDYRTFVEARRFSAAMHYFLDEPAEGSKDYASALGARSRYQDVRSRTVEFEEVQTNLSWAGSLGFVGDCEGAHERAMDATAIYDSMTPNERSLTGPVGQVAGAGFHQYCPSEALLTTAFYASPAGFRLQLETQHAEEVQADCPLTKALNDEDLTDQIRTLDGIGAFDRYMARFALVPTDADYRTATPVWVAFIREICE